MKTLSEQNARPAAGQMPTTHWSVVLQAALPDSPQAQQALETLCRAYWYPLYAYLRRDGKAPPEAQDLTQGFFAHILGKEWLAMVERKPGMRFRSWLLTSLRHYAISQWRRDNAQIRGGGQTIISIDADDAEDRYRHEPPDPADPVKLFERKWTMELLQRVLSQLEDKYSAKGKQSLFTALQPFVLGGDSVETHGEIARRLNMNPGTVTVALSRLRERYHELLRAEIAHIVGTREEVEDELRHLAATLE